MHNRQSETYCDGRIHGVSTHLQNFNAGLRSQFMDASHHGMLRMDGMRSAAGNPGRD